MRVLIVNTSERKGGAAVAANRLTSALINNGVQAKMLVMEKQTRSLHATACVGHWRGMLSFLSERVGIWLTNLFSRRNLFAVSTASSGSDITRTPEFREADIIHLHWINQGFLSLRSIRKILDSGKPVVWTMHDMWETTGICHHSYGCMRFRETCGRCPFLRFPRVNDLSRRVMLRKQAILKDHTVHFVAVSNWLADMARQSSLTGSQPISVIPNVISLNHFRHTNRDDARSLLGLPDKPIIVFGAARVDAPIKGLSFLLEALRLLVDSGQYGRDGLCLVLFGGIKDETVLDQIPVDHRYLGYIKDETDLARLYSAANVLVSASFYETFGQTLIEAQACGCIPVSFGNSGQRDIIEHKVSGYLADYKSAPSLADGIRWALQANIPHAELRRRVVGRFSESVVARAYTQLYETLTNA